MQIGKKIREIRQQQNLSQEDVARDLSVSRQAVSKWESGKSMPDIENLMYISNLYGTSLDELVKGDSPLGQKIIADTKAKQWHKLNLIFFISLLGYIVRIGVRHDAWLIGLGIATIGMIVTDTWILRRTRVHST